MYRNIYSGSVIGMRFVGISCSWSFWNLGWLVFFRSKFVSNFSLSQLVGNIFWCEKCRPVLSCVSWGSDMHEMPGLRDILPPIHTMGSHYQSWLRDICHQLWKRWRSWSSRYTVVERSNLHCYRYVLFGAPADLLTIPQRYSFYPRMLCISD